MGLQWIAGPVGWGEGWVVDVARTLLPPGHQDTLMTSAGTQDNSRHLHASRLASTILLSVTHHNVGPTRRLAS